MDELFVPRLVYCVSTHKDAPCSDPQFGDVLLSKNDVTIGRAVNGAATPDISLTLPSASREHARIVRDNDGFRLHCLSDQGIQLYERTLSKGDSAPLNLPDYWSLPAERKTGEECYIFCFTLGKGAVATSPATEPLQPIAKKAAVMVYGRAVHLTPTENRIFRMLYDHPEREWSIHAMADAIWNTKDTFDPLGALEYQLKELRKKLKTLAQGGALSHWFLDFKMAESARLCLEDVAPELARHALRHPAQRTLSS